MRAGVGNGFRGPFPPYELHILLHAQAKLQLALCLSQSDTVGLAPLQRRAAVVVAQGLNDGLACCKDVGVGEVLCLGVVVKKNTVCVCGGGIVCNCLGLCGIVWDCVWECIQRDCAWRSTIAP